MSSLRTKRRCVNMSDGPRRPPSCGGSEGEDFEAVKTADDPVDGVGVFVWQNATINATDHATFTINPNSQLLSEVFERVRTPNLKTAKPCIDQILYVEISKFAQPIFELPEKAEKFRVRTRSNAEPNLNVRSGSGFGSCLNRTRGSGSAFGERGPEPEPNRTLPALHFGTKTFMT
ncbi:hypothetical protein K438DRAFT_1941284 [Mycena galopus ATCC 62051]|nr:hypothetical protein K438DRAFT_1941284 [Mycena galopus ATCC 62051]